MKLDTRFSWGGWTIFWYIFEYFYDMNCYLRRACLYAMHFSLLLKAGCVVWWLCDGWGCDIWTREGHCSYTCTSQGIPWPTHSYPIWKFILTMTGCRYIFQILRHYFWRLSLTYAIFVKTDDVFYCVNFELTFLKIL